MNRYFTIVAIILTIGTGSVWGTEAICYTMNCPKSTSNTDYTKTYDITVNDIDWKTPGNQNFTGWKLGGKLSSATDRYMYSKTPIAYNITKMIVTYGTKDTQITVNSVSLNVYSTAAKAATGGTGDISSVSGTFTANGTCTFTRPDGHDWTGRFYRLNYNLNSSASGTNYGIMISKLDFYAIQYNVTWMVGGASGTEEKSESDVFIGTPPDVDDDALGDECSDLKFVGWSETDLGEVGTTAPGDLFKGKKLLDGNKTFYAVFAEESTAAIPGNTTLNATSFSLGGSYSKITTTINGIGYTIDQGVKNSSNIQMNDDKGNGTLYNTTALSVIDSVKVNVASGSNSYKVTTGTSQNPTTNSGTGTATKRFNALDGDTYFQLQATSGVVYFSSVVVYYHTPATYETSSYRTVCVSYTATFNTGANNPTVEDITGVDFEFPEGPTPYYSDEGWEFAGWATATCSETTKAPHLYMPGDGYTMDADKIFYAVYRQLTTGTTTVTLTATSSPADFEEHEYFDNCWVDKTGGVKMYIPSGSYTSATRWNVPAEKGAYVNAHRKISTVVITALSDHLFSSTVWNNVDDGSGTHATMSTSSLTQTITCSDNVVEVGAISQDAVEAQFTTVSVTYYNTKFNSNPYCNGYSFHYGPNGSDWEKPICFEKNGEHDWKIENFTIPSHTNGEFYVGYQNSTNDQSNTVRWTADPSYSSSLWQGQMHLVPYNETSNDMENWGVGQAVGAIGTLSMWDNSSDKNQFVGFEPEGYGISFGGNSYAFGDASDHVRETKVVTLPADLSTTYAIGLKTATGYVKCNHSETTDQALSSMAITEKEEGNIRVYMVPNSDWKGAAAKYAIWDATHSQWGLSGEFMEKISDDLYVGYVQSGTATIVINRMPTTFDSPSFTGNWNQTVDISVSTLNTKYTISSKKGGTGADKDYYTVSASAANPTASTTGKFRMWDNNSLKNWCTHFIPYYVWTYDANGGSGTMDPTERNTEETALTATKSNSFTSPTGKHFTGWNTDADGNGTAYAAGSSYDLTENATLYAQWTWDTYTISYDAGTNGSGSKDSETKTYGVDFTLPSSAVFTRTGYTQTGWTTSDGGDQTHALGAKYTTNAAQTFYPVWTANTYTLTLNKNGGDSDGEATVKYDATSYTTFSAASKTGYSCTGYWTATSEGTKVLGADGSFAASAVTGYITSSKWSGTSDEDLYAQWSINSYTLAWNKNADDADALSGSYTSGSTTYNTELTAPNIPTRTGYTFSKWNSATDGSGDDYTGYMPAGNTTYYAQWTVNGYDVSVTAASAVTITATPSGGSAIAEEANNDVNFGTTVTLNYSSLASGSTWGGWRVYKSDDASTTVTVSGSGDGATFTMPAYAVVVSAYTYGDVKAWCDPDITISDNTHLTSVNGVTVYSTLTTSNLLTIVSNDLAGVTKLDIKYLNADDADAEVAKASSLFRLCNNGTENYNVADGTQIDVSASNTCDLSYSISYTPSAYNATNHYKLQITMKDGTRTIKTVTQDLWGRSLPEEYVIAVKRNNQWYALPNTIVDNNRAISPQTITVNNETTPTAATYAPTTTIYKGAGRYASGTNVYGVRLTDPNGKWLQVSNSSGTNYVWVSGSGSRTCQDWWLSSSDFSSYTLKVPSSGAGDKSFGINNLGNIGFYASDASNLCKEVFLLPITNKYTDFPATVTEWGQQSVILAVNAASADHATAQLDAGSATSNQTITPINETKAKAKNFKVTLGDIDLDVAEGNEGKLLYINWLDGSDNLLGMSCVTIPRIVAEDRTANKTNDTDKKVWNTEVHVLPGATLTIDGSTFVAGTTNSTVSMNELHVYPGATINVSTGTLNATTLRLHNGWTRAGDKKYDVARVYINAANHAKLTKTTASMDYDIYEQSDGKHYYPLAVPFSTAIKGLTDSIDYIDPTLARASKYGTHYVIKEYDGANRAANGEDSNNNWDVVSDESNLVPGKGYIMTAVAVKGEAIIRVPLVFDNAWTADGELGTANYDDADHTKNVIAVTAYGGAAATAHQRHAGWNMLGVPFMSSYGAGTDMYSGGGAAALINGELVVNTSAGQNMEYRSTTIPYVSVPTHDFSEYIQTDIKEAKLLPGWSFFVQVGTTGNLTFLTTKQREDSNMPIYAPKREESPVVTTGIVLSNGEKSDKTTLLISDNYSSEYEIGADLEKMFGSGYTLATYSLSQGTRLAFNALSTADAAQVIPVGYRAPEAGQYTFAINPRYATEGLLRVELIDYQTGDLTDLLTNTYTFTTSRTQDDTRFAIHVTYTDPNSEMPTGEAPPIETGETLTRKFILNGQLYIQRGTVIYDATGKEVRL